MSWALRSCSMRSSLLVFGLALTGLLAGCGATSHMIVGTPRPAIPPSQVKVYLHPPQRYEEIAVLDASSKESFSFTDQGKMDVVVARLKEDAAKLGANGILLTNEGEQYAGSVGTGAATATAYGNSAHSFGTGFSGAAFHKQASGIAIYVPE